MKILTFATLLYVFFPATLLASEHEPQAAEPAEKELCEEAITLFQDVSGMGRKDRAANNMTKSHEKMARTGWRFADMEIYIENGDLEGFFLSYTRMAPCPPDPE